MVRVAAAIEGTETLIIMPRDNSEQFRELCDLSEVPYVTLPLTRITKEWRVALAYCVFSPFEVLRLARLLKRERINLVHASGGSWQYKAILAGWLTGIPSVWHLNDTSMPNWIRYLFRLFSRLPAGFIFASHRSKEYYGSHLAARVYDVIPSTVDVSAFDKKNQREGDEDLLKQLSGFPVVGTVANVSPVKGLETLIRCAAELLPERPDIKLLIVGPVHANQSSYHKQLVELARTLGLAENVIWAGQRADVRPLMARMNVYVCSSIAESSPVSVWEAMAMEKAIVSTDVGDVSRHLLDGDRGYVVPVEDFRTMAKRVEVLLENKPLGESYGARARDEVHSNFSPSRIAGATKLFYQKILDGALAR